MHFGKKLQVDLYFNEENESLEEHISQFAFFFLRRLLRFEKNSFDFHVFPRTKCNYQTRRTSKSTKKDFQKSNQIKQKRDRIENVMLKENLHYNYFFNVFLFIVKWFSLRDTLFKARMKSGLRDLHCTFLLKKVGGKKCTFS